MITRVDHIALAVNSIEDSKRKFENLYGAKFIVEYDNPEQKYRVAIMQVGENIFSLLESTDRDGFVAKYIERFGEGVQHIGVDVGDLDKTMKHLKLSGAKTAAYTEVEGVKREALVGGRNAFGVVFQLMEWLGEYKYATPDERMRKVWS